MTIYIESRISNICRTSFTSEVGIHVKDGSVTKLSVMSRESPEGKFVLSRYYIMRDTSYIRSEVDGIFCRISARCSVHMYSSVQSVQCTVPHQRGQEGGATAWSGPVRTWCRHWGLVQSEARDGSGQPITASDGGTWC